MEQLQGAPSSNWAAPIQDHDAFAREQAKLAHVWTFLGLTSDAVHDGDWFRASLATRSVFVQRFGSELKGFENRCMHRFFPLRNADKGSGPIVCGFHHWRYDREGRAVGIPMCQELFGKTPRELGVRLNQIDVQTCGSLVFGRFPAPHVNGSLEDWLGESFPIIEAISRAPRAPYRVEAPVKANWRLCYQITLDDYHQVAVHTSTFGKNGYPDRNNMSYFRFGQHSAFLSTPDSQSLTKMQAAIRDGSFHSSHYFIFQIFPNLIVSHGRSDAQYWHILIQQFVPLASDRSLFRSWSYPAPFAANHAWYSRFTRLFTDPWRRLAVRYVVGKIRGEDQAVCENIQTIAGQINEPPIFGSLEERVAWFEEAYSKAVTDGDTSKATTVKSVREPATDAVGK